MAVFTPLPLDEAHRIARELGLADHIGELTTVVPVAAGSVNSNFFLEGTKGRVFFRVYEEQEKDGVAYEWALLDHLTRSGLPVPTCLGDVGPGDVRVAGKPTAAFASMRGTMSCQKGVTPARLAALGQLLAEVHATRFGWRREGRFRREDVRTRLGTIPRQGELGPICDELEAVLDEVDAGWPSGLGRGVTHGDLFRDNVFWEGDELVGAIDWESASDNFYAYDLVVTMLAWCCDDVLEWELGRELVQAYDRVRPLSEQEKGALRVLALSAAARFTVTRITDFHLREGVGERVHKDYRRFLMRLRAVRELDALGMRERLGL